MAQIMRLETGSNNSLVEKKISVKLPAGGDLFVIDDFQAELSTIPEATRLRIELLTKRMMLIPTAVITEAKAANENDAEVARVVSEELSKGGISHYDDESVIRVESRDKTALVIVPKPLLKLLAKLPESDTVTYDVPILREAASEDRHLMVDSHMGITTIMVFERGGELSFADIYETPTAASTIYWVQRVARAMKLERSLYLYIYRGSGTMRRLLQRDFKKMMICE